MSRSNPRQKRPQEGFVQGGATLPSSLSDVGFWGRFLRFLRSRFRHWASPPSASVSISILALLCFTALLMEPLLSGRALYWGDILLYFAPMSAYQKSVFMNGQIPLWNPYILLGQPFVGNPQMGVFYPGSLLLLGLDCWIYLSVSLYIHLFLCGAFMALYLRRWVTDSNAALCGALIYTGSEFLVGRMQFPPMVYSAAYFPFLLYCIDNCLDTRPDLSGSARNRSSLGKNGSLLLRHLLLAGGVALLLLAAHTQMAYLELLCVSAYAIVRLWRRVRAEGSGAAEMPRQRLILRRLRMALPLAISGLIGLMTAMVQLLPALQLLLESPREQLTAAQANRFVFDPSHLLTLLLPRFFGHPASGNYWGGGNAWEPALFIGWLPLLLIGYAVRWQFHRQRVRWAVGLSLLGLWMAMGNQAGLYWIAFKSLPGLANFHDPARFLLYTTFGMAVLAALGWETLQARIRNRWANRPQDALASIAGLIGVALPLCINAWSWNPTAARAALPATSPSLASLAPAPRRYHSAQEYFWKRYVTDGYADYRGSDALSLHALAATDLPNLNMFAGKRSASGYEPVPLAGPAQLDILTRTALKRNEPNLGALLVLLNAEEIGLPRGADPAVPGLHRSALPERHSVTYWRANAAPPAWIVFSTRRVEGKTRLHSALAAPDFDPYAMAIVSGAAALPEIPSGAAKRVETRADCAVSLVQQTIHQWTFAVEPGRNAGLLIVSAAAYPGWQARVEGHVAPIVRVDGGLIGVSLPPEARHVTLTYLPGSYRLGLYGTMLGMLFFSLGIGTWLARRWRAAPAPAGEKP